MNIFMVTYYRNGEYHTIEILGTAIDFWILNDIRVAKIQNEEIIKIEKTERRKTCQR